MINWNEVTAINTELPSRVRNFQKIGDNQWKWSCDICGDSRTNTRKARLFTGYDGKSMMCFCHNCGWAGSFKKYTELQHPDIYRKLNEQSFLDGAMSLFSHDDIINKIDSDEILIRLFFIDRYKNIDQWIYLLKSKKISLNRKSLQRLLLLHKAFHQPLIEKEKQNE